MPGLTIACIDHVSVLITALEPARHFYREILGLREIPRPKEFDFVALWFDLNGQQLHLLQMPAADTVSPRHFALRVADIHGAREHFARHGIRTDETVKIRAADRFFIRDPDGNRIEIIQWEEPYNPTTDGADKLDGI